jgi:hypothetical protein
MEHHRCFHVYIVKTRAKNISNLVFFKHQYKSLVLKATSELTSALKGTVLRKAETADAFARVSKLFHKIAEAKAATAKAKEQRNTHRTHPNARRAVPLPRVLIDPHTQPAVPLPRVQAASPVDDCCVVGGGSERQIVHTPLQIVGDKILRQGKHRPPAWGPIIYPRMKMKSTVMGTTPSSGRRASCRKQCLRALTSPNQISKSWRQRWQAKNYR